MPVTLKSSLPSQLPLPAQRQALLARIHAAREETAQVGRKIAVDLQSFDRARRSLVAGLKMAQAAIAAAGLVWSLNASLHATSRIGRRNRLFTVGLSTLSTLRALQRINALWKTQRQPRRQTPSPQQLNQG